MKNLKLILLFVLLLIVPLTSYNKTVYADNSNNNHAVKNTNIFEAVQNKDINSVQEIIESGIDIDTKNNNGKTSLTIAVEVGNNENIVKLLLDNGADVEGFIDIDDEGGNYTPLFWAVITKGNYEVVKLLIDAGADVNVYAEGYNILAMAVSRYYSDDGDFVFENIKVLIENGADVNSEDLNGYSLLMFTAISNDLKLAKLLIENGANVNHTSYEGEGMDNALLLATQEGNIEIIKLLLNNGADVNYANEQGMTALFIATNERYKNIIKILKEASN